MEENVFESAERADQEIKAAARLSRARSNLVMGRSAESAFFASIVMSWRLVPTWELGTMGVDGVHLFYNPSFVVNMPSSDTAGIASAELDGVLVHEAMHDALGHHLRLGDRDQRRFNVAADLAINQIVLKANYKLPKDRLLPGEGKFATLPPDKSAEEYYVLIADMFKDLPSGDDPGGCGAAISGKDDPAMAAEINRLKVAGAVGHARQQHQGNLPGWLDGMKAEGYVPKVNWKSLLRIFLTRKSKSDYSWSPPNRRFISQGFHLPSATSENAGYGIISVDCSGSCWDQATLSRFAGEVNGILNAFKAELTILYSDTRIVDVKEWKSGEGKLVLEAKGGGGTSHECVFEWVAKNKKKPDFLVCLTDMYTSFPKSAPEYPVLWCSISKGIKAPWGRTIEVEV